MKFITYTDMDGNEHFFDASRVMFTMSQEVRPAGHPEGRRLVTKVALNENMGFILADEDPASIVARIKEANNIG